MLFQNLFFVLTLKFTTSIKMIVPLRRIWIKPQPLRVAITRSKSTSLYSSPSSTTVDVAWLSVEAGSSQPSYKNLIGGTLRASAATSFIDVKNPATQEVVGRVPHSPSEEVQAAIDAAQAAFPAWRKVPIQQRQRIMLKYQSLIRDNTDALAYWITLENGKTLADAKGDIFRGLEVVETCCNMADKMMGETLGEIGSNIDCISYRQPLGSMCRNCPFIFLP
jgi:malonate-semialdehyde dehydrogenase (acetylating)/methylmalonate-semialdehyde dehydrogenase